jgi:hypothetical protein
MQRDRVSIQKLETEKRHTVRYTSFGFKSVATSVRLFFEESTIWFFQGAARDESEVKK